MKRILLFLLSPMLLIGQTQHDRIKSRGASTFDQFSNTATIPITGATPSISGGNVFSTNNSISTTITNFIGGVDSQQIVILCRDSNTIIQNNANISVTGGTNFSCIPNVGVEFVFNSTSGVWAEVGGTGSGGGSSPGAPANSLQKNNGSGGFTASAESSSGALLTVGEDSQFTGPNPYFDLRAYGGSTSTASTTASCTSGSPNVTLASAQDFTNGQGIVIHKCGAATTLTTPSAPTVSPLVAGSTTYNYCLVAEDRLGGLTPCGLTGTTTVGSATLGQPGITVNLTQAVVLNGVATYTCATNCNLNFANWPVLINGFTDSFNNGVKVVTGNPSSTTFTTFTAAVNETDTASGTLQPLSANVLTFPINSYSGTNTLRYWIYKGGNLAGVTEGLDPYFVDFGQGVGRTNPSYIPASAPGGAQNEYLETTISSGGGTVNLVLSKNAGATIGGQTTLHDNSVPLLNLMQTAFYNGPFGPPIYLPNGIVFNGTTDMVNGISSGGFVSAQLNIAGAITLNQPWIMRSGVKVLGVAATSNTAFQGDATAQINLNSHPGFYISGANTGGGAGGFNYSNIIFQSPNINDPYTAIYSDLAPGGGGTNGVILNNISAGSRTVSPIVLKGAFGDIIRGGAIGGSLFVPSIHLTNSSSAVTGTNNSQTPGNTYIDGAYFGSVGVQVDCNPNVGTACVAGGVIIKNVLMENQYGPLLSYLNTGSSVAGGGGGIVIDNSNPADQVICCGIPLIEAGILDDLGAIIIKTVTFSPVLFSGEVGNVFSGASTTIISEGSLGVVTNNGVPVMSSGVGQTVFSNLTGVAVGTGRFIYPMGVPAAPVSAVVSAGGSAPTGTYQFKITAQDVDGFESFPGPTLNGIVVSSGNQTVTITRGTLPAGATGWFVYAQSVGGAGRTVCAVTPASTTTVVWNAVGCGNSSPNIALAAAAALDSGGIYASAIRLASSGFVGTFSSTPTANRTWTIPDVTGSFCITGAPCSATSVTVGGDSTFTASPREPYNAVFPGALTTTWTGETFTLDKAITVTRVQVQLKTAPSGCGTNAVIRLTDGTTPINLTLTAATNDSGALSQNYASAAVLSTLIQTAAAACTISPGDANVVIQYKMQ